MNIQEYIESGILEAYVLDSASEAEVRKLFYLKDKHPEIRQALQELERDMEHIAEQMAVPPPPLTWLKIEAELNSIIPQANHILPRQGGHQDHQQFKSPKQNQYIEVEAESTHMRVHKAWKWIFAVVFILSKIFLICTIYFYLENKHAQEQIQELKTELRSKPVQP